MRRRGKGGLNHPTTSLMVYYFHSGTCVIRNEETRTPSLTMVLDHFPDPTLGSMRPGVPLREDRNGNKVFLS